MSLKFHCDRCDAEAPPRSMPRDMGPLSLGQSVTIPDQWRIATQRVGSKPGPGTDGANRDQPTSKDVLLCAACDGQLVNWFIRAGIYEEPTATQPDR